MDKRELNHMFDKMAPDPARERELLGQLLRENTRRKRPMKNWKRVVLAAAAAALLVTGAAAAVFLPRIDQRVLDRLNVDPENSEAVNEAVDLLYPGAMELDITKEDNGATLHVTQILRDRYTVMILADLTAPEGTVFDLEHTDAIVPLFKWTFINGSMYAVGYLDEAGEQIGRDGSVSSYAWNVLEEASSDNHLSLMLTMTPQLGEPAIQDAAFVKVPAVNLGHYGSEGNETVIYSGDWSFEAPLPQREIGSTQLVDQVLGELDGASITMGELYLSPMSMEFKLTRDGGVDLSSWTEENQIEQLRWHTLASDVNRITLTTREGKTVLLQAYGGGGTGIDQQAALFRLLDITDPAQFQGGTLTLDWACGKTVISLDDLAPVEPAALTAG